MKKVYILILAISFFSCKKDKVFYINTHFYNATLDVNIYRDTTIDGVVNRIPLRYVIVQLYKSNEDLEAHRNQVMANQTDVNGYLQFFHLTSNYYYLRANHYIYGVKLSQVATPDATESHVEIDY